MAVRVVLIISVIAQLGAAGLALRLNQLYRRRSAWILISAAAILMTIGRCTTLVTTWSEIPTTLETDAVAQYDAAMTLWTESCISLLVSILFLAGIALIEPLFVEIRRAEELLKGEKKRLEQVVRHNEDELRLARQIQENLFPREPPKLANFDIAGASLPAEWTSGDYFDYIPLHGGSYAIVVADVSGHGTGAALLMSETRAFLRALAETSSDVGEILTRANRSVSNDVEEGRFVTILMVRLDVDSRTVVYTSAGHNGYLLRSSGEAEVLSPTGLAMAIDADAKMTNAPPLQLKREDVLLLITDGILETHGPDNGLFGEERMFQVVRENRSRSAEEIVEAVFAAAREFSGGAVQRDDNTAVVIKVC